MWTALVQAPNQIFQEFAVLEVPDVQGVLRALPETPGPSFLASEALEPLLQGFPSLRSISTDGGRALALNLLGMPELGSALEQCSAVRVSMGELEAQPAFLALLAFPASGATPSPGELIATRWNAESYVRPDGGRSWSFPLVEGLEMFEWGAGKSSVLVLQLGQVFSPEALQSFPNGDLSGQAGEPPSGFERLGEVSGSQAGGSAFIWLRHSRNPLGWLAKIDAERHIFHGNLAALDGMRLCSEVGEARLGISKAGYVLDIEEPAEGVGANPIEPALVRAISADSMMLFAGQLELGALFGQLDRLISMVAPLVHGGEELRIELESWLELVDDDAVISSHAMNSTSPPKSFLSLGLLTENHDEVLSGLAKVLENWTGLEVAQRVYRVRNRSTKERFEFPIYTLVMPKQEARGLLTPSISPAFTIADGRIILSPRSMYLKNELRRKFDGKNWSPATPGPLQRRGLVYPKEAQSLSLIDSANQLSTLIAFLPMLSALIPDLPFELEDLPDREALESAFPSTFGYSLQDGNGIHRHVESAIGFELALGVMGVLANIPEELLALIGR